LQELVQVRPGSMPHKSSGGGTDHDKTFWVELGLNVETLGSGEARRPPSGCGRKALALIRS
jgi:hypothetical protein